MYTHIFTIKVWAQFLISRCLSPTSNPHLPSFLAYPSSLPSPPGVDPPPVVALGLASLGGWLEGGPKVCCS